MNAHRHKIQSERSHFCLTYALLIVLAAKPVFGQVQPTVYSVSLAESAAHLVHVKIQLPPGPNERDLQLPVWDALYQVRDFSQYVNWVRAEDSEKRALAVRQADTSRWHLSGATGGAVVDYEIFANASGPYNAELNSNHAFFNLAQILMYPVDARSSPIELRFTDVPDGWHIATALEIASGVLLAPNYDRLVDSPVEIGKFKESDFDQGGVHYRIVVDAKPEDYDMGKVVSTVRPIVAAETAWMDDRAFQNFLFIYHFPEGPGGGGMEHAYSTAIEIPAQALRDDALALSSVTAHEFFHLWNVKRIRPQSLEPRNFARKNVTPSLWFSEGFTNTVGEYTLLYAGMVSEPQFLSRLAAAIGEYERRPAHLTQSAEAASTDAWLEKYNYYLSPQRSISYYNKGQLLGVLLDLKIREATQGKSSLRDLFQWMDRNYAQKGRFFADTDGVREAAETVAHADFKEFFQDYVAGTKPIPWNDFFSTVGLQLDRKQVGVADFGFVLANNSGRSPIVASVTPGSPAGEAGLSPGDSVMQINGHTVSRNSSVQLSQVHPGDILRIQIKNAQGKRDLQWKVGVNEQLQYELNDMDNITPQQKARRHAWLNGESQVGEHRP